MQGQVRPTGTVTLPSAAPTGGTVVTLASSNTEVARVPATVTVGANGISASFAVDTSTVTAASTVAISASYAGTTRSASLTVQAPPLIAAFTVTSPAKGANACVLGPAPDEADCQLAARGSQGFIAGWVWTYLAGTGSQTRTLTTPLSTLSFPTRCELFNDARGGDDANGGKFLEMEIQLYVRDAGGNRSNTVRQPVRLYPNRLCGFNY